MSFDTDHHCLYYKLNQQESIMIIGKISENEKKVRFNVEISLY